MPPGPHEATAEQLQHHLKPIVDDLIVLYEDGVIVKTTEYPDGKINLERSGCLTQFKEYVFVWLWSE